MDTVIHIGYPKTATTWLQKNYFPLVEDIQYMDKGSSFLEMVLKPNVFEFDHVRLRSELKTISNKRIVISNEDLIGVVNYGWYNGIIAKEIATRLSEILPGSRIIIFIRNQINLAASVYLEYIKAGGTRSFSNFNNIIRGSEFKGKIKLPSLDMLQYHNVIGLYSDLFGAENVRVYLYEELQENIESFIRQFSQENEFKLDFDKLLLEKSNVRLRKGLVKFMRFCNCLNAGETTYKYYLMNLPFIYRMINEKSEVLNAKRIFGKEATNMDILGKDGIGFIEEYYRKSNNILVKELGLDSIRKYNYPL